MGADVWYLASALTSSYVRCLTLKKNVVNAKLPQHFCTVMYRALVAVRFILLLRTTCLISELLVLAGEFWILRNAHLSNSEFHTSYINHSLLVKLSHWQNEMSHRAHRRSHKTLSHLSHQIRWWEIFFKFFAYRSKIIFVAVYHPEIVLLMIRLSGFWQHCCDQADVFWKFELSVFRCAKKFN